MEQYLEELFEKKEISQGTTCEIQRGISEWILNLCEKLSCWTPSYEVISEETPLKIKKKREISKRIPGDTPK